MSKNLFANLKDSTRPARVAAHPARRVIAALTAATIACASPVAHAAPDLSGLLSVIALVAEGDWIRVNMNAFSDVWTPEDLRPLDGLSNPAPDRIIAAWSSFAWDGNRGDVLLYGGGHANYSGNDVYRWRATTGLWERASLPSEIAQDGLGNWAAIDGPDAAPASAHTYDNNVFLPIADRFVVFGGAAYNNGGPFLRQADATHSRVTGPYFFDPARADPNKVGGTTGSHVQRVAPHPEITGGNMWQNRDITVNIPGNPQCPRSHVNGVTAYAQEGGKDVVYVGGNAGGGGSDLQLYRYVVNDVGNPAADTCEQVGRYWTRTGDQGAGAYDPARKLFVDIGSNSVPFWYWNLSTASPTNNDVGVVPTDLSGQFWATIAADSIRNFGMDFDPVRGRFVLWGGGGSVWTLTPPATIGPAGWTVAKQPVPSSSTPTASTGTGVLGKWKYVAELDAFIALEDPVAGNVWVYKPIGWINPLSNRPPTVALASPAPGRVYTAPANVTLSASASDSDGTIAKVEFFRGAVKIGESASPPYAVVWTGAPAGSYTLTARATDNEGAATVSSAVSISINAAPVTPHFALYRPSTNKYFVDVDFDHVPDLRQTFGAPGDIGLAGRFDADGLADFVLYRNGMWFADTNRDGWADVSTAFGGVPGDVPLLADFNGDGRDDLVIYRDGTWFVSTARNAVADLTYHIGSTAQRPGVPGDLPLAADVDGDGLVDLVIYRNGIWYVDTNRDGTADMTIAFGGLPGDVPVLFDWDGDGKADLCIFRSGIWYVNTTRDGTAQVIFGSGTAGDLPLTGIFR